MFEQVFFCWLRVAYQFPVVCTCKDSAFFNPDIVEIYFLIRSRSSWILKSVYRFLIMVYYILAIYVSRVMISALRVSVSIWKLEKFVEDQLISSFNVSNFCMKFLIQSLRVCTLEHALSYLPFSSSAFLMTEPIRFSSSPLNLTSISPILDQ